MRASREVLVSLCGILSRMNISPKLPRIAAIVAFLAAGIVVLDALIIQIVILPLALIPLCAGLGILRRRVWSAYGYAVFTLAQLALVPLVLFRLRHSNNTLAGLIASTTLSLLIAALFLLAGRSLAQTGAVRGLAWPWIAVSIVCVLPLFFVEQFVIPTGAMENTILIGDRIMVQTLLPYSPARGDIVTFIYPVNRQQTFVKRIVGMPGDRIRFSGKVLYRNGMKTDEPYAVQKTDYMDSYRDNFPGEPNTPLFPPAQEMLLHNVVNGEVVVPTGKYFVVGDNRDQSLDSRYWGFISAADIIGKPLFIYYSADQSTQQLAGDPQFPWQHNTRWNRIFKPL